MAITKLLQYFQRKLFSLKKKILKEKLSSVVVVFKSFKLTVAYTTTAVVQRYVPCLPSKPLIKWHQKLLSQRSES